MLPLSLSIVFPAGAASSVMKRGMVKASFIFTKQPARIRQVLGQVNGCQP
jgi:hypothetical protein